MDSKRLKSDFLEEICDMLLRRVAESRPKGGGKSRSPTTPDAIREASRSQLFFHPPVGPGHDMSTLASSKPNKPTHILAPLNPEVDAKTHNWGEWCSWRQRWSYQGKKHQWYWWLCVVALLGADLFCSRIGTKNSIFSDLPSGKEWGAKNCALRCTFVLGETLSYYLADFLWRTNRTKKHKKNDSNKFDESSPLFLF